MSGWLMVMTNGAVAQRLGWTLVHSVWEVAGVALVVGMVLALVDRGAARARYAVGVAGLGAALLLAVGTFWYLGSGQEESAGASVVVAPAAAESAAVVARAPKIYAPDYQRVMNMPDARHEAAVAGEGWLARVRTDFEGMLGWVGSLWMLGVLVVSGTHVGGWVALQRMRRLRVSGVEEGVERMARALAVRMRIGRGVVVARSLLVKTPMVIGMLRPMVLVPASVLTGLSEVELRAVLAHELAHVRRHDYVVNLLQVMVETLLFFHPGVWWMSKQVRREREHCCDDLAAAAVGDRVEYAEALVAVAALSGRASGLALGATGGGSMLMRVRRLVGAEGAGGSRRSGLLAATALSVLLVALPLVWGRQGARGAVAATQASTQSGPKTVIHGKVLETGTEKPVAGAEVWVADKRVKTDGAGRFTARLGPGTWQIRFAQLGRDQYLTAVPDRRLSMASVALDGTVKERTVMLHIPPVLPVGVIHGKVEMPDGSPAAGILVVPNGATLVYLYAKKADAEGVFSFAAAPAGRAIDLYAETADHKLAFAATVKTTARLADQDVGTFKLRSTTTSDVVMVDAHGKPLADVDINVQPTFGKEGLGNMTRRFTTDGEGRLRADGILPGLHYKLNRPGLKYVVRRVLVGSVGVAAPARILLDPNFVVRVVDEAGKGVGVKEIQSLVVKALDSDWRLGPQPKILATLADGSILIDRQQLSLAYTGNEVTMRFTSADGEPMVAKGIFVGGTGSITLTAQDAGLRGVTNSAVQVSVGAKEWGGRIVDGTGKTVAGATVSVPDIGTPYVFGKMKVMATTDAGGVFRVPTNTRSAFYLQIDKAGYARRWLLTTALPKGRAVDVRLDRSTRLALTVRLADGQPAGGAVLTAVTSRSGVVSGIEMMTSGFQFTATADASGRIDVPVDVGTWELRVNYKGEDYARETGVVVGQGATVTKAITVSPGVDLRIRAVDATTGKPIAGAAFFVEKHVPGEDGVVEGTERKTDASGEATWGNLMPGEQGIGWTEDLYPRVFSDASENTEADWPSALTLDLKRGMPVVVVRMEKGMRLTGKVVDGAGKAVARAEVNVIGLQTGDWRYARETDAAGRFSLMVPAATGQWESNYKVGVVDPSHPQAAPLAVTAEFTPKAGGSKSFVIVLKGGLPAGARGK